MPFCCNCGHGQCSLSGNATLSTANSHYAVTFSRLPLRCKFPRIDEEKKQKDFAWWHDARKAHALPGFPLTSRMPEYSGVKTAAARLGMLAAGAGSQSSLIPVRAGKMDVAIASLIGTPQAAYLWYHNKRKVTEFLGVQQTHDGQFSASAPVGKKGALVKVGRYSTIMAAARARDAAMFEVYGHRRVLNFPEEYPKVDASCANDEKAR